FPPRHREPSGVVVPRQKTRTAGPAVATSHPGHRARPGAGVDENPRPAAAGEGIVQGLVEETEMKSTHTRFAAPEARQTGKKPKRSKPRTGRKKGHRGTTVLFCRSYGACAHLFPNP